MSDNELEAFLLGVAQSRERRRPPKAPPRPHTPTADDLDPFAALESESSAPLPSQSATAGQTVLTFNEDGFEALEAPSELTIQAGETAKAARARDASPAAGPGFSSKSIAALLASPERIRQAFVLSEVLRSPVERWERNW